MTAKKMLVGLSILLSMTASFAQPVKLHAPIVDSQQRTSVKSLSLTQKDAIIQHLVTKYKKPEEKVRQIVYSATAEASAFGISPLLILAMVEKESGLRHDIVNRYGAVGLMQVVPRYHKEKLAGRPVSSLKNPKVNLEVGTLVLKEYLDKEGGNLDKALKQYSGGSTSYKKVVMSLKSQLETVAYNAGSTFPRP